MLYKLPHTHMQHGLDERKKGERKRRGRKREKEREEKRKKLRKRKSRNVGDNRVHTRF